MTATIQEDLAQHHLLPDEQIVDTGYVDAELLVSRKPHYGIRLVGPVLSDNSWQAKADKGFDVAHFQLDWPRKPSDLPARTAEFPLESSRGAYRSGLCRKRVCAGCPVRSDCTQSQTTGRVLHLRPQAAHSARPPRRQEQQTSEFRKLYAMRAGIEGTLSQGVRSMGLRRARYDGLQKVHLQHVLTAVAINLVRIDAVLTRTLRGKTRRSNFARLALHPGRQGLVVA